MYFQLFLFSINVFNFFWFSIFVFNFSGFPYVSQPFFVTITKAPRDTAVKKLLPIPCSLDEAYEDAMSGSAK